MDQSMVVAETMSELLKYLIAHLAFLYDKYGARFVDSQVHGPHAMLVLETADLRLRIVRDRGQLFLDFQSAHKASKQDWFSFDIIHQFLTNKVVDSAELDGRKVGFVKQHFAEISEAFSAQNREKTEKKLHEYERLRAKRLFG